MKHRIILGVACIAALLWRSPTVAQPDHAADEEATRAIVLSVAERQEFGLVTAVAGPAMIEAHVEVPGEVRPNADRLAHIVPRFSGIVTQVHANLGDHVRKGQVLATIESDESLTPFPLETLISGTVIQKHITLGEAVSRDRDTYVIADLSNVWIDLTVYQRDLDRIHIGQTVHIHVGHAHAASGTISYVTPIVHEATRTATARVVLDNDDGRWRPGMFVTGDVVLERVDVAVAVPRTAIHNLDGESVVFIETDDGFEPQHVRLGRSDESNVEIVDGLSAGQHYVTQGGFTLKAELGKDSLGSGHAH
jgi:cobalt-zinc-cadmium efflux system membrane fusion protein